MRMLCYLAIFAAVFVLSGASIAAAPEVLDARFRPDRSFDHFARFWKEKPGQADQKEVIDAPFDGTESADLGGSLHVYLRNSTPAPTKVDDVRLEGVSLKEAVVYSAQRKRKKFASIFFSKLPKPQIDRLVQCGEPVWWRANPMSIPAGGTAEIIVRLRSYPKAPALKVEVVCGASVVTTSIKPRLNQPRIRSLSFAPSLGRVYAFLETKSGDAPRAILLDGRDVTAQSQIEYDARASCTPVTIKPVSPLALMSFHVIQAKLSDGSLVSAGGRAWSDEFVYGMFGGRPGRDADPAKGRAYVEDITSHNINVQMPQVGSPAVVGFMKSQQGRRFCEERGLRSVVMEPGKFGEKHPVAYYVHDEPDAGDYHMEGVAENRKVGGMAQWCIEHAQELRAADPAVPEMINIDSTYKPANWYIYGQLTDIFASDPYFQSRLADAYSRRPERIPLYKKATYLYAVSSIAESAGAPRPLHIILNAVEHAQPDKYFRFATPQEKRLELYYAIAAGAKGISYWWFTPGNKSNGVGAADHNAQAASLWREIGLLGAEVRTAGPLLLRSCPTNLPVTASTKSLWTRCLATDDAIVLIAVNDQYTIEQKSTPYQPLENVSLTLEPPAWLNAQSVFEITSHGIVDLKSSTRSGELSLALGHVDLTRLIVIARETSLRSELARRYQTLFAGHAVALESHR